MKTAVSVITLGALFLLKASSCFAFLAVRHVQRHQHAVSEIGMGVDLVPEPEGGEEVTAKRSMPGTRVKNMGQATGVRSDDGTPYSFWMTSEVEGALVQEIRIQILKDAKKKANFPGFRKVRSTL